jgi:hypothetical protein
MLRERPQLRMLTLHRGKHRHCFLLRGGDDALSRDGVIVGVGEAPGDLAAGVELDEGDGVSTLSTKGCGRTADHGPRDQGACAANRVRLQRAKALRAQITGTAIKCAAVCAAQDGDDLFCVSRCAFSIHNTALLRETARFTKMMEVFRIPTVRQCILKQHTIDGQKRGGCVKAFQ